MDKKAPGTSRRRRILRSAAIGVALVLALFLLDATGVRRMSGKDFPVKTPLGKTLQHHVEVLASPAWGGRVPGTKENAEAADYLAKELQAAGLVPYPPLGRFHQRIGDVGDNVVASLPADASAGAEGAPIVLGAHFDHVGKTSDGILLGADDNASAVAVLLGALPLLRERTGRRHPIVVAFFNTEEMPYFGTPRQGSRFLFSRLGWARPGSVHLTIVLDLIGGVVWWPTANTIFACGAEKALGLSDLVDRTAVPELDVRRLGINMVENIPGRSPSAFSDYDVFRDHQQPFLFLSSGRTPRYHAKSDVGDTLYYDRMARTSRWIADLVALADAAPPFAFDASRTDPAHDLVAIGPLVRAAANPLRSVPGTGPLSALRLLGDLGRVRALEAPGHVFTAQDQLDLERASFRVQCLLYSFPVCFTL